MRTVLFALCLLWFGTCLKAQQSRTDLEKQRQETLRELDEVNSTYNEVKKNKKESLGQLNLVLRKIKLRNQEIDNINAQIRAVNDSMFLINREIFRLKGDLDTLKANYAKSLIYAYKSRSSYDFLNFIFSATSFNDAVRRVEYLKSYRANREQQVADIIKTEGLIQNKVKDFANTKIQKGEVLSNDSKARIKLEEEKEEKNEVVANLKSREKELSSTISNKRRQLDRLHLAISTAIRHEIDMAKKEAAVKAEKATPAPKPTTGVNSMATTNPETAGSPGTEATKTIHTSVLLNSDEEIKLAGAFQINKGRLPWPVAKGYIITHYGKNVIEGTKLDYYNPSVTIGTDVGMPVKVVFDGQVSAISGGVTVIVKHGNYFTSYANLSSITVKKGDQVHTGEVIGQVAAGDSGNGQLEFFLMKDQTEQNPELWLRPSPR